MLERLREYRQIHPLGDYADRDLVCWECACKAWLYKIVDLRNHWQQGHFGDFKTVEVRDVTR